MLRKILLVAAVLCLPVLSSGETCTAPGSNPLTWTAVGTVVGGTWSGCTPTNDDNFVIPATASVTVAGNVTLTTGSVSVTGGTLIQNPGTVLTPGTALNVSGGIYRPWGRTVWTGRINDFDVNTGGAAGLGKVTIPGDLTQEITANFDMVVFLDEDPEPGRTINGVVQVGSGEPDATISYRPAFAKWRWHEVDATAASAGQTVIDFKWDEFVDGGGSYTEDDSACLGAGNPYPCCSGAGTGTCGPYVGTRGPGLVTPTALVSATRRQYGLTTELRLDDAGNARIEIDGDLGAQYVEYTSGTCTGKMAKIVHTDDDVSGTNDAIWVFGDAMPCGQTPNVIIHYGMRDGDLISVIEPAVVDGNQAAHVLWTGGKIEGQWVRFLQLDDFNMPTLTPSATGNCNFCIAQSSATVQPESGSYLRDFEIGWPMTTTADTFTLQGVSYTNLMDGLRFPAAGLLDLTGIEIRRGYIHDQINNSSGEGCHGNYFEGVKGATLSEMRIERLGDDGVGAIQGGYGIDTPNLNLSSYLVFENIAGTANSQQGLETGAHDYGTGADHNALKDSASYTDFMLSGVQGVVVAVSQMAKITRLVTGGMSNQGTAAAAQLVFNPIATNASADCVGAGNPAACCSGAATGTCAYPIASPLDRYSAQITDSYLGLWGGGTAMSGLAIWGGVHDGNLIEFGGAYTGAQGFYLMRSLKRTLVSIGSSTATGFFAGGYTTANLYQTLLNITDSVVSGSSGRYLCDQYDLLDTFTLRINRGFFAADYDGSSQGFMTNCDDSTNAKATVYADGAVLTTDVPTLKGFGTFGGGEANGANLTNVCTEVVQYLDEANVCGSAYTDSCIVGPDWGPDWDEDANLRDFLGSSGGTICEQARPRELGFQTFGVSHAMMGDLVIEQSDRWSNKDLIKIKGGGGNFTPAGVP